MKVRTYTAPEDAKPAVGLLSNGSYTVTASVTFTTAVADSRQAALALVGKYHAASVFERAVSQASTRAQAELCRLQADIEDAHLFRRLAGLLFYSHPALRPRPLVYDKLQIDVVDEEIRKPLTNRKFTG